MKVLYDHSAFSMQKYGGISRYFSEIVRNIQEQNFAIPVFADFVANNVHKKEIASFVIKPGPLLGFFSFYFKNNIWGRRTVIRLYNNWLSVKAMKRGGFDVFHTTYFDPYFLPYLEGRPYIVTVHDMIHEKFLKDSEEHSGLIASKKMLVENAAKVIAISHNTKKDVVEMLNIDPERVEVIYHGIDFNTGPESTENPLLPDSYILFVGGRAGYKNFDLFIRAFAKLSKRIQTINVVCTGLDFTDKELSLFNDLEIGNKVFHFFAKTDGQLALLYKKAKIFVYPSLYEGFGMPILEAFTCGCPVVLSNASCFPEIAGNAAAYFDPNNADDMTDCILTVLNDEGYRAKLIDNGKGRLNDFSWKKSAEQTFRVYDMVHNR